MELAITFTLGVAFVLIGLSCMVRTDDWIAWLNHLEQGGRRKALSIGSAGLIISALVIGTQSSWTSGLSMLIATIGFIGLLESTLYLLFPSSLGAILSSYRSHHQQIVSLFGAIMVLLGGLILYGWWMATGRSG